MTEHRTRIKCLPTTIRAFSVENSDGSYDIILNARMSDEQQKKSYLHELRHIMRDDFRSEADVDILESEAHDESG